MIFFNIKGQFSLSINDIFKTSLLDFLFSHSKKSVPNFIIFSQFKTIFSLKFLAYYNYLISSGIDLEEIFQYYFTDLTKLEYNQQFFFSSSSSTDDFYQRSKSLIPELDSILKQFDLYQKYGRIDAELLELSSKNANYKEIKSSNPKKYIYFNSNKNELMNNYNILFNKRVETNESLYKSILSNMKISDFPKNQQEELFNLEKASMLNINKLTKVVKLNNVSRVNLYHLIWNTGYLSTFFLNESDLKIVEEEIKIGNLIYGDTLFSKQEMNYISFVMDKKMFNNGLDLRNKIVHGSLSNKEPEEYKLYYIDLLIILLLYTVKINEELEYKSKNSQIPD